MRTHLNFFAFITAAMCLASCGKDALVNTDLKPDTQVLQRDLDVEQTLVFTSWQDLVIAPPDCPDRINPLAAQNSDAKPIGEMGCMGTYGFTGYGQGYVEGLDRFFVNSHLKYDPESKSFNGMIAYEFASSESTLRLKIEGPAEGRTNTENGMTLMVPVRFYSGSGMFEYMEFEGVLKIIEADEIFNARSTDYKATLLVEGEVITF